MHLSNRELLASCIVLITLISVNQWSTFPIGNTFTNWILYSICFFLIFRLQKNYHLPINNQYFTPIYIYLIWITICILRGFFLAEYYWDFKNLLSSGFALFLAYSVFIFTNPALIWQILRTWIKYSIPLFGVIILFIPTDSYGFFLIPISFFTIFYTSLETRWKFIFLGISIFIIFADFDARSNGIKFTIPFIFSLLFYFKGFLNSKVYRLTFKIIFIVPIILLVLGLTQTFNVFQLEQYISGDYSESKIVNGEKQVINLKADTRTFLYEEVINSAIKHQYLWIGRTPARGNDSELFGSYMAENLGTSRYERYGNEVSMLNIFTWIGLIGVILYTWIFYRAAYLAITQSNNHYLKILGIYIAFRYVFCWIEDVNRFDINNVMLWIMICICYSYQFRRMTDGDFKTWLHSILNQKILNII